MAAPGGAWLVLLLVCTTAAVSGAALWHHPGPRKCRFTRMRIEQEGLATWLAGPLPSDSAVLEVVSLPSSEKRSQSDESSSPVMNVDAPSWVNSVAPPADAADPAHACVVCLAPSSIS